MQDRADMIQPTHHALLFLVVDQARYICPISQGSITLDPNDEAELHCQGWSESLPVNRTSHASSW